MIMPSVADLIELFDAEGAFIFVDHRDGEKPMFHVEKASSIREAGSHFPTRSDAGAVIAPDLLFDMPAMLADMARSIANDVSVDIVFAYTEDLANRLVSDATKIEYAPYMSGAGRIMDFMMQKERGTSAGDRETRHR